MSSLLTGLFLSTQRLPVGCGRKDQKRQKKTKENSWRRWKRGERREHEEKVEEEQGEETGREQGEERRRRGVGRSGGRRRRGRSGRQKYGELLVQRTRSSGSFPRLSPQPQWPLTSCWSWVNEDTLGCR